MKTIKFAMFLFYRYYRRGRWESAPYFSSLCAMSLLVFLNFVAIFGFLHKAGLFFAGSEIAVLIRIFILLIIFSTMLWRIAPEKTLRDIDEYSFEKIVNGNFVLVGYMILSMLLFIISFIVSSR